ncbi:MAG: hypothetical protein ABIF10_04995 [Candidatus Woesearchaeota archaeon]
MSNHTFIRDRMRGGSRSQHTSRNRAKRAKTFASEEAAKAYAEKNGIKEYVLQNLRPAECKEKKIRVVAQLV